MIQVITKNNDIDNYLGKVDNEINSKLSTTTRKILKDKALEMSLECVRNKWLGLAANQIGLRWRFFIMNSKLTGSPAIIINPKIIGHMGSSMSIEACLSIPGGSWVVFRYSYIKVEFYTPDRDFNEFYYNIKEYFWKDKECAVFQHELDHLNGIVISDIGKSLPIP